MSALSEWWWMGYRHGHNGIAWACPILIDPNDKRSNDYHDGYTIGADDAARKGE